MELVVVAIYVWAGIGFYWFLETDRWRRVLMGLIWPIGIAWSMVCVFIDFWKTTGYDWGGKNGQEG